MFGYVNVLKDELKIKDYNIYRAYYCGLCHEIGKRHNQLSRLGLNYDLTMLAIMLDSLNEKPTEFCSAGCIKKTGKRKTKCSDENLSFAADMNVLLAYFKLLDDIKDNHSFKALIEIIPFSLRAGFLKKKYPLLCENTKISLNRLSFLEKSDCNMIDKAAHEFAVLTEALFKEKEPLFEKFGYSLGRLIYILDAYDDMHDDWKKKNYNPAVLQYSYKGEMNEQIIQSMSDNIYYSLADVSEQYEKLPIKKNKQILDNIIYLGLRANADRIINERKQKDEKSV